MADNNWWFINQTQLQIFYIENVCSNDKRNYYRVFYKLLMNTCVLFWKFTYFQQYILTTKTTFNLFIQYLSTFILFGLRDSQYKSITDILLSIQMYCPYTETFYILHWFSLYKSLADMGYVLKFIVCTYKLQHKQKQFKFFSAGNNIAVHTKEHNTIISLIPFK